MKKILFMYSIIVVIGVSFYFAFSNPSKTNLIASFFLVPIPAYLFILITDPKGTTVPKWSLRIVLLILTLSVFVYLFMSFINPLIDRSNMTNPESSKKTEIVNKTPSATPSATGSGEFTDILMEEAKND